MNLPIGLTITRIVAVPLLILFLISSSRVDALIAAAIFVAACLTLDAFALVPVYRPDVDKIVSPFG